MALLALLALAVALVLAKALLGVLAVLSALGVLAVAFLASLAVLPWQVAVTGWLVSGGLVVLAWHRDLRRGIRQRADVRMRIRDLEKQADDSSLPFEVRVVLRRQAFDLRCVLEDWEGFP